MVAVGVLFVTEAVALGRVGVETLAADVLGDVVLGETARVVPVAVLVKE